MVADAYDSDYYADGALIFVALYNNRTCAVEYKVRQLIRQPDGNYSLHLGTIAYENSNIYGRGCYLMIEVDCAMNAAAEIRLEMTDAKKLNYAFHYIETHLGGEALNTTPVISILHSQSELDDYRAAHATVLEDTRFDETTASFDESYFADHTLVFIALEAETSRRSYDIWHILQYPDNQYEISMEIGIFDMDPNEPGACLILLEIDGLLAENAEIALETMVGYWKDN